MTVKVKLSELYSFLYKQKQKRIQNSVKHLRWSILQKYLAASYFCAEFWIHPWVLGYLGYQRCHHFSSVSSKMKRVKSIQKITAEAYWCSSEMWIICWTEIDRNMPCKKWLILAMLQTCVLKQNRQWILSFSLNCLLELYRLLEERDKKCIFWTESIEMAHWKIHFV